jgi:hypothetical protein
MPQTTSRRRKPGDQLIPRLITCIVVVGVAAFALGMWTAVHL